MSKIFSELLNDRQYEALEITDRPVLILAGAGSGKTRVITHKLAYLIENRRFSPYEILALTFTNKAADEMKSRVSALLNRDEGYIRRIWVSTFHSACARILRFEAQKIGLTNNFTIYDTEDSKKLIKEIMKKISVQNLKTPADVYYAISWRKNKPYPEASDFISYEFQDSLCMVWEEYERRLMAQNAVDFDNIILKTIELLANDQQTLRYYQGIFKYIMVDEFQDTNDAQYELIRLINGERNCITVVGDDDQSVYGFRGAQVMNVSRFVNDFSGCEVVRLEQNYRSTQRILDAANSVIQNNTGRIGKTLWTENVSGDKIQILNADNDREEGRLVVNNIKRHFKSYKDFAIFYRVNSQSRIFEELLKQAGFQYQIYGTLKFYERREIKDILAYLYSLVNEKDDINLIRIINVPRRGIGDKTLQEILDIQQELLLPLFHSIKYALDNDVFTGKTALRLKEFVDLIEELRALIPHTNPLEYINIVLKKTGYLDHIAEEESGEERLNNIQAFVNGVSEHINRFGDEASIYTFLNEISLYADTDNNSNEKAKVFLMTVHNAKGLEFDKIYITGLEEGIFPHARSLKTEMDIEEERRLFYVALTRAKKAAMLSTAQFRSQYGNSFMNLPSRFIGELDSKVTECYLPNEQESVSRQKESAIIGGFKASNTIGKSGFISLLPAEVEIGDILIHDKFGEGTVVAKKGEGDMVTINLRFTNAAEIKFILKYTKLIKKDIK